MLFPHHQLVMADMEKRHPQGVGGHRLRLALRPASHTPHFQSAETLAKQFHSQDCILKKKVDQATGVCSLSSWLYYL
jgi:hypothetical protein